jgi:ABC-2 type transport system permease protein
MKLLLSATINEWVKLTSRKKTLLFLFMTALLPFLGLFVVTRMQDGLGIAGINAADYPLAYLTLLAKYLLPLHLFMMAADLYAGEAGDRTLRAAIVRPISRFKIYASKQLAMFALLLAHLAVGAASSIASAVFLPAAQGSSLAGGLLDAASAYAAAAVPLFVLSVIAAYVAQLFRNATGALTVSIVLYGAAMLLAVIFPAVASYSPTSYMDWHTFLVGSGIARSAGSIMTIFSFLLGCGIVFYTAGLYQFDHKEI